MTQISEASKINRKQYNAEGKSLTDALNKAIKLAEKDISYVDGTIHWKLVEIGGFVGGFAPTTVYRVTIEALE